MGPDLQRLWQDVKQSPALLITLVVVAALVIWYVYSQNNSGSSTLGAQPAYEIDQISVTPPSANQGSSGGGTPNPNPNPDNGFTNHTHLPGTTFTGPTGVKHYVTTGNETLSQIAQKLGLSSWNDIYSIPENKQNKWVPAGLTSSAAASYKPAANVPLVY